MSVFSVAFERELSKQAEVDTPHLAAGFAGGFGAEMGVKRLLGRIRNRYIRGAVLGGAFGLGSGLVGSAVSKARGNPTSLKSDIVTPTVLDAALGAVLPLIWK